MPIDFVSRGNMMLLKGTVIYYIINGLIRNIPEMWLSEIKDGHYIANCNLNLDIGLRYILKERKGCRDIHV